MGIEHGRKANGGEDAAVREDYGVLHAEYGGPAPAPRTIVRAEAVPPGPSRSGERRGIDPPGVARLEGDAPQREADGRAMPFSTLQAASCARDENPSLARA